MISIRPGLCRPQRNISMPVTKLESSDVRNNAALAISLAFPIRPIGMVDTIRTWRLRVVHR